MDKQLFMLDDAAFDSFEQALESNPVQGNQRLQQLLERPKRWN